MGCSGSKPSGTHSPSHHSSGGGDGLFLLHDADFTGRDDRSSTEGCNSIEEAVALIGKKSKSHNVCYAWRGKEALVTIPTVGAHEMGNGAKWSTGAELIVCAKDTGHRAGGKILVALKDVDCCFGDGAVFNGVHGYDAALRKVIEKNNPQCTAYFLHTPSNRLIEKPKGRGANWVGYDNYGWLFLWVDERLSGGGGGAPSHGLQGRIQGSATLPHGRYAAAKLEEWKWGHKPHGFAHSYKAHNMREDGHWQCEGHAGYRGQLAPVGPDRRRVIAAKHPDVLQVWEGPYGDNGVYEDGRHEGTQRWMLLLDGTIRVDHIHYGWASRESTDYEAGGFTYYFTPPAKTKASSDLNLGATPSHGNPSSTSQLNTELNNVARNTDDTAKARALVAAGADLSSTNGPDWRHTPLHQASFHGRLEMARCLVELGAPLHLQSNPCGRGSMGTPLELARGGGHHQIATMLEQAMAKGGGGSARVSYERVGGGAALGGAGVVHAKPGGRFTYQMSQEYAEERGGRLLTLEEARDHMSGQPLYGGEDQWCAVQGRDWVQVGDRHHHPGKSHNLDCHHYPPWGDDANNQTYGNPSWNYVVLYRVESGGCGGSDGSSGRSPQVDWNAPLSLRAVQSSPMDGNGPLSNITSRGGGFANFGGRSGGHGCFPHWVIFEGCEGRLVAGVEMKAYVAGESPKTMAVETSDGKNGPWRPVASLSADAAWGEDVPWARVSEPDPAVKHWSWAPMKLGRYLRLTFTSSFNGDAPTMYHTFFYPPVPMVEAVPVQAVPVAQAVVVEGGASSSSSSAASAPALLEVAEMLKRELGIEGSIKEVITIGCEQLDVDTKGMNLVEQATECWRILRGGQE